ncbi:glycosyltransferase [Nocardioides nematodiphilus]|uniref:glycosyltransferase n=1 Tax=Nocardioides nematodiphilus TaxID=2849669 RepID=UPI001CD94EF7|nr:glycosyltransferase [Nocardioides nematodiphilus]MCA1983749.1 glycosyltransferase [Nocardioides nematodiphilus]
MTELTRWFEISRPERPVAPGARRVRNLRPSAPMFPGYRVAAIVPCLNEAAAIANVVTGLLEAVPGIDVYVYDNNSTDGTAEIARAAGAIVRTESRPGKGNVVRRAFADIDADIYVLIDGDDTYEAAHAPQMIRALMEGPYDHVLGVRTPEDAEAYRGGHEWGNRLLNGVVARLFGENARDMLSGYRVFSRRFVKSFPATSRGFEIETELTVHCLTLRVPCTSLPVGFRARVDGSESKLHTFRDGRRILQTAFSLFRYERPLPFYAALIASTATLFAMLAYLGHLAGTNIGLTVEAQFAGMVTIAVLVAIGVVVDVVTRTRHGQSHLVYMHHPAVPTAATAAVVALAMPERELPAVTTAR